MSNTPDGISAMKRENLEDYARALRADVDKLTAFVRKVSELPTDQTASSEQCALVHEAQTLLGD